MSRPLLVSMEFTVPDLDACLHLLVDLMGLELTSRDRHPVLDAEIAQVDGGGILLNLVSPTDTGEGVPHERPESGMSQLDFVVDSPGEADGLRDRLVEGGAAIVQHSSDLFLLDAGMVQGLFGVATALVVYPREFTEPIAATGGNEPVHASAEAPGSESDADQ